MILSNADLKVHLDSTAEDQRSEVDIFTSIQWAVVKIRIFCPKKCVFDTFYSETITYLLSN